MARKDIIAVAITIVVLFIGRFYGNNAGENELTGPADFNAAGAGENSSLFIGSLPVSIVTYTDSGFSPATVAVPKGSAILFRNYSSKPMRVASGSLSADGKFPCRENSLDSCANIPPNVSWSFVFNSAGKWNYHDGANPRQGGTIIVK